MACIETSAALNPASRSSSAPVGGCAVNVLVARIETTSGQHSGGSPKDAFFELFTPNPLWGEVPRERFKDFSLRVARLLEMTGGD